MKIHATEHGDGCRHESVSGPVEISLNALENMNILQLKRAYAVELGISEDIEASDLKIIQRRVMGFGAGSDETGVDDVVKLNVTLGWTEEDNRGDN